MRDNNVLTRHLKPAARKLGFGFRQLALSPHFPGDLDGGGRRKCQRRAGPDAAQPDSDHLGRVRTTGTGIPAAGDRGDEQDGGRANS